ncbi:MAG TPA: PEGA domain-containing protein [Polyangiaceae bacterium]|nr:PEGA domain-containing protein [Polyangiaceae bacterium]
MGPTKIALRRWLYWLAAFSFSQGLNVASSFAQTAPLDDAAPVGDATPTPGRLSVGASVLPADLLVDGQVVGPLPWSGELPPGEHKLLARSPSAASSELVAKVISGETTLVTLSLSPRTAKIDVNVADASIYVDEQYVGVGQWSAGVPPGKHQLRLKRIGYAAKEYEVTLAADETWSVSNIAWGPPNAEQQSAPEKPSFRGVYAQIGLIGLFSGSPTDQITQDCPAAQTPGGSCEWHPSYGGGLAVHVGYSFGWIAVEGVALGLVDAWYNEAKYQVAQAQRDSAFFGPPRSEQYTFLRYGGSIGVGARLLSPTPTVRATLGLSIGLLERQERYFRVASATTRVATPLGTSEIPDASADASDVDSDPSALLLADAGVLFGSTPGLKFHLGVLLAATFGSSSRVGAEGGGLGRDPTSGARSTFGSGAIDISRGSQLFFGPILGVQFGH